MLLTIIESIDFNQEESKDVILMADVTFSRADNEFFFDVIWDECQYSREENNIISGIANKQSMYDRFIKKYRQELEERLLESSI